MSIKIALSNHKGGVGKTSLAGNVAYGLAARGHSVLAMDMDPQANLTLMMGHHPYPGAYDFLVRDQDLTTVMRPVESSRYGSNGQSVLAVIGGNIETKAVDEFVTDSLYLSERLAEYAEFFEYVVIDTPPTHARQHSLVFRAVDYVLIPTDCDAFSLKGMQEVINATSKMKTVKLAGVIPNKIRNTREDREVEAELREHMGDKVWETIKLSTVWKSAVNCQYPLFVFAPKHEATDQVWRLINWIESWEAA
jgi:chromosome partitioning protein